MQQQDTKQFAAGNTDWSGGMDSSRFPSRISENQYFRACNVMLPRSFGGVETRNGIHHQDLVFEDDSAREVYHNNAVQDSNWYNNGRENILIKSVAGFILEFRKISQAVFKVRILNKTFRNSEGPFAWITRVPFGVIINDGINNPIYVNSDGIRRTNPEAGEIGVGLMGTYVQNRFFYVTESRDTILASDFGNPISLLEGQVTNIPGFRVPEDEDEITAIGPQKQVLNYVEGQKLAFSTLNNYYSIDVRGNRQDWEIASAGVGKVQQTVSGIGAISSYSFEPFNSNVYFRTSEYGIANIRQSQYQFTNNADFESQSIEVDSWLDRDTEVYLDRCFTRRYRGRLYTTIAPEKNDNGDIFWNGMVVEQPDPIYSNQDQLPRRFTGIITGVRPWCMTSVEDRNGVREFYIDSYDEDGKTRLYKFSDLFKYDTNKDGQKVEIKSWIETRGYTAGYEQEFKKTCTRYYSLRNLIRPVTVKSFSSTEGSTDWVKFAENNHNVGCVFPPENQSFQDRKKVDLPEEMPDRCTNPSSRADRAFCVRQYRLEFEGEYSLTAFITKSMIELTEEVVDKEETEDYVSVSTNEVTDFNYLIK